MRKLSSAMMVAAEAVLALLAASAVRRSRTCWA
jgi:hypothetical protein